MALTLRRTTANASYYTEPLEGPSEAIPLQMLLIPAGTFLMGSPADEPERQEREGPQHEVTVPPFFMGRYPITQAQWREVAAMPQLKRELKPDASNFKGDNRPVESVSWHEAVEFCDRLAQHTGRPYRLPTEAEWEHACRAGTATPFHFGKTITTEVANYNGRSTYANGPKGPYRRETTPVDTFNLANLFGLCDMHGNVYEWCADYYGNYDQTPTDGSAFITEDGAESRIFRGGSWDDHPKLCRSVYRNYASPDYAINLIGFRVSCSAPRT